MKNSKLLGQKTMVGHPKAQATGIKAWPLDDRPREKLLKKGAGALSNSELLAILLRTGNGRIYFQNLHQAFFSIFEVPPINYVLGGVPLKDKLFSMVS